MLSIRLLTAFVMLTAFLAALFYLPDIFWAILLLGLTVTAAREWCRLGLFSVGQTVLYMILTTLLGGELLFLMSVVLSKNPADQSMIWFYVASILFWLLAVPIQLATVRAIRNPWLLMSIGWLVLLPVCLSLYQLRAMNPLLLLGFMGVVWISDSAAYFIGRAYGKNKLAPQISPGKTWEGVVAALIGVLVYALIWFYAINNNQPMVGWLVPLLLILAVLGIVGDLYESLLKRQAGVKDSGRILPGHGGVLDRIDALLPVLPVATLAAILFYSTKS
ncbi:phosphatidate cytidylyltransferase [Betaproteobacteria bacterium PRO4]|uniref:phosphatidate cytidylyltransferase n=1 Tax=Nitrosomonas sp. TaxID=42353 RepID=UPI002561C7D0|nr:phosphatidate cytidylyltransferase [Nitrosomonas sp.]MDL1865758.1 phosphatidate cytidylyltransferase [Betaproteobacteria bacterium PRO4]